MRCRLLCYTRQSTPYVNFQRLNLSQNNLGDAGVRVLADALRQRDVLHRLSLYVNSIRHRGMKALTSALPFMTRLRHLELGGNFPGLTGVFHLAQCLRYNSTLYRLDMSSCDVHFKGEHTRILLEHGLQYNTTLFALNLSYNHIGVQGCQAFSDFADKVSCTGMQLIARLLRIVPGCGLLRWLALMLLCACSCISVS